MGWFVLYTKPKSEIKVADSLRDANFEVFCPTTTVVRQWSDRRKRLEVPLFTSYVFIRIKNSERSKVFGFPGVIRYLFWLGKPAIARDEEIDLIKAWLNDDRIENIEVRNICPGDRVRIKSGPFKERVGMVQELGSKRIRLVLQELGVTVNLRLNELSLQT
ncbi:UpxY family transcription antiterminator [Gramella sp. GC03-9]|uniref:UpxY family transcription antiterminator n=1 Tax=Christiangramia oceanisediminis TaxID=2920386 RepID=A0A9X2I859_9FLAO|nr:UpxY family transcription antiterminator [Gramella oceanisediminis]MCP9199569.1 UpxY family transcription antiterminator [Gramella oceanisediminis]